jgi:GT2 family glycosyltransferase
MGLNPLVEISVAVHNQWAITEKFLKNLFLTISTYDSVAVNIIDNASTDNTVNELEKYSKKATIFSNDSNKGFAFAHNMILRKSYAPFSCILHNDVVLPEQWLNKMVSMMQENPKIGVLGAVNNVFGLFHIGGQIEQDGSHVFIYQEDEVETSKLDFVSSSCMLFKNQVYKTISVFDEKYVFGWNSDVDFCVRAKEEGFLLEVCNDVVVDHFMRSTARIVNMDKYQETNRIRFVQKNKEWLEKNKGRAIVRKRRKIF